MKSEQGENLDARSCAESVYLELKNRLDDGRLKPGAFLDLGALGAELEMSRTPLRDALIRLEIEGFVRIYPRRGVMVRSLGLADIRDVYEVIGALEASAIRHAAGKFRPEDISRMDELRQAMDADLDAGDFSAYYSRNLAFHDVYLDLSENAELVREVRLRKERLYDFPRRVSFVEEWERSSNVEHLRIVEALAAGDCDGAACLVRDVHWSYEVQERFIRRYYADAGLKR